MSTPLWQKSSYCAQGESCVHVAATAQRSSYCQEGEACIHISAPYPASIHLTESADPAKAVLTTGPVAFGALLSMLKVPANEPAFRRSNGSASARTARSLRRQMLAGGWEKSAQARAEAGIVPTVAGRDESEKATLER
ncbi:DUF397 domain-containing protein [Streptomyces cellulosae]|uniref:DUF397 domain-containing protein n=1 Tax=Streptomyces cellulosae TaxID=1968 RepID=A0ABW7Y2V2_STRCE